MHTLHSKLIFSLCVNFLLEDKKANKNIVSVLPVPTVYTTFGFKFLYNPFYALGYIFWSNKGVCFFTGLSNLVLNYVNKYFPCYSSYPNSLWDTKQKHRFQCLKSELKLPYQENNLIRKCIVADLTCTPRKTKQPLGVRVVLGSRTQSHISKSVDTQVLWDKCSVCIES